MLQKCFHFSLLPERHSSLDKAFASYTLPPQNRPRMNRLLPILQIKLRATVLGF
jgi:hypothetical protein